MPPGVTNRGLSFRRGQEPGPLQGPKGDLPPAPLSSYSYSGPTENPHETCQTLLCQQAALRLEVPRERRAYQGAQYVARADARRLAPLTCFTPVEAWQLDSGQVVFCERGNIARSLSLRCGQCVGCRKDRAAEWAARILHESQLHAQNWFVTLTYDDKHLPPDGSLDYSHFQAFMRRLRKSQRRRERKAKAARVKIRFYMAGEYGEKYARPHYHACLFGASFPDMRHYRNSPSGFKLWRSDLLDELWSHGLCSLGALSFESAAYTAGYINKKVLGALQRDHYTRVNASTGECHQVIPEFARMSLRPGIGARWFERFSSDVLPRDYVIVQGRKTRVPRYYVNLFRERDPLGFSELETDRYEKSLRGEADRTPARLAVRHQVAAAKAALSRRKL